MHKGSNLTVYLVLLSLELFRTTYGRNPEEIYCQIDGGGENANVTLLAIFELLGMKGMFKVAFLTHLPTGHTHEDFDGEYQSYCHSSALFKFLDLAMFSFQ